MLYEAIEPDYTGKRVLLVEDNELNMEILEAMVSLTGVQIEKAEDGQQAVNMVEASADGYYDLIFMDILQNRWILVHWIRP